VLYTTRGRNDSTEFWHSIVVNLGGIAAEMVEFKRMRSGTAKSDLQKALHNAKQLAEACALTPPWDKNASLPDDHFDVSTMFRSVDTGDKEARILNLAYTKARAVVEKDRKRMLQIAGELARCGVIEPEGVTRIFGTRLGWPFPFLQ